MPRPQVLLVAALACAACGSSQQQNASQNDGGVTPFEGEPGTLWSIHDKELVAIDTKDGHIVREVTLTTPYTGEIHYGAGAVWMFSGGGVVRVDAATGEASSPVGPADPSQGAFGAGAAWYLTSVAGADHSDLVRVDAATSQVTTYAREMLEIPTGNGQIIAASDDGVFFLEIYGAPPEPRLVHVDPSGSPDFGFVSLSPYLPDASYLAHGHCAVLGKTVYVLLVPDVGVPHKLVAIDVTTHAVLAATDVTIAGWSDPDDRLLPTGDVLYIEDRFNSQLHRVNPTTLAVEQSFDLHAPDALPTLMPQAGDGIVAAGGIWLADGAQRLDRIDLGQGTWAEVPTGAEQGGVTAPLTFQPP